MVTKEEAKRYFSPGGNPLGIQNDLELNKLGEDRILKGMVIGFCPKHREYLQTLRLEYFEGHGYHVDCRICGRRFIQISSFKFFADRYFIVKEVKIDNSKAYYK